MRNSFIDLNRRRRRKRLNLDWNSHPDQSLHSVHGQVHAGPHSIPTHSDNGQEDSGAFVAAGTAGQQGFDVRTLGLTEQELQATGLHPSMIHQGRQLPLDQYKINYDPNPIIIRKQIPIEMPTYKQQVIVRYRKFFFFVEFVRRTFLFLCLNFQFDHQRHRHQVR